VPNEIAAAETAQEVVCLSDIAEFAVDFCESIKYFAVFRVLGGGFEEVFGLFELTVVGQRFAEFVGDSFAVTGCLPYFQVVCAGFAVFKIRRENVSERF